MQSKTRESIIIFVFLLFSNVELYGQCKPAVWCFKPGETLNYQIVYNWGFIWVDAGKVEFKAKQEILNGKQVYHFSGAGVSLKKHDWFFRVRDSYNSWTEMDDLKPIKYSRNTSEGKHKVKNYYNFDHLNKKIYTDTWNSEKARAYDTISMPNCVFDIMTAVYYARTIDLNKYKVNDKIPIKMIVDNEIYELYARFLGKETIKTRDKKLITCLKFSILLVEGTMFKGGEDLFVWISDDENRIPVLVKAKVLVGSVKAIFKKAENLKKPIDYTTRSK